MKLTLERKEGQLVLIASSFANGPNDFIGAVYRNARGDQPIKFSLYGGLGDSKICQYGPFVNEDSRKQHANAVATELSVELQVKN